MDDFFTGYNLNLTCQEEKYDFLHITSKVVETVSYEKELESLIDMNLGTNESGDIQSIVVVK